MCLLCWGKNRKRRMIKSGWREKALDLPFHICEWCTVRKGHRKRRKKKKSNSLCASLYLTGIKEVSGFCPNHTNTHVTLHDASVLYMHGDAFVISERKKTSEWKHPPLSLLSRSDLWFDMQAISSRHRLMPVYACDITAALLQYLPQLDKAANDRPLKTKAPFIRS